jgi:hypothetical protein
MRTFITKLLREGLLNESYITQSELNRLEKELDALFADVGIDIDFTEHFFDRVNHKRNEKDITIDELRLIFKNAYGKYKDVLGKYGDGFKAVFRNRQTQINIPFSLQWDSENDELDLVSKTVMRTNQFFSKEPFLTVDDPNPVKIEKPKAKDKFKKVKLNTGDVVKYYEQSNRFTTLDDQEINLDDVFDHLPEELQNKVIELAEGK